MTTPASDGRRLGILAARWLGIALLGLMASACCPHPPGFIPRIPSECSAWDYKTSRHEIRAFANDLADRIPGGETIYHSPTPVDYRGLKAAALKMARAPRCVQETVLESYRRAYADDLEYDISKSLRMALLLRVLFVLPTRLPLDNGKHLDLAWPVHEDPSGRTLEVERHLEYLVPGYDRFYDPLSEYYKFIERRYRMRTPAEIQALEIRDRP